MRRMPLRFDISISHLRTLGFQNAAVFQKPSSVEDLKCPSWKLLIYTSSSFTGTSFGRDTV